MNYDDRKKLEMCCEKLVPKIDMTKLWPKLFEHGIYDADDVNVERWKLSLTDVDTVRSIYLTIKTRGPAAFQSFLKCLRQTGHESLANELEQQVGNNEDNNIVLNNNSPEFGSDRLSNMIRTYTQNHGNIGTVRDDNFYTYIQHSEEPLKIRVRQAERFLDEPDYEKVQKYPMRSNPRGLVLLVTNIMYPANEPRDSAKHDKDNLIELFEGMGFKVIPKDNLSGEDLKKEVKAFSQLKALRKVDSCFVIVTSHGAADERDEAETVIQGVDYAPSTQEYQKVFCNDIPNYFTAEACPHLAGKPKVFIYQLCRGKRKQKAVRVERYSMDGFVTNNALPEDRLPNYGTIRNYQDTLIVYSTLPGYVAYRDNVTGSWFIQILCEVFMNHAHDTHIQDLFNMVDERLQCLRTIGEECQTVIMEYKGFSKHCYLNPGLFH